MTRLTEEMVIARSKVSDLAVIKKLNCWGSELSDVNIIKRMRGVEVLALSVNSISTLQPFEDCKLLQELYLRKNKIQDINEVRFLQSLPVLKSLWLEENPFCDKLGANYRPLILRALPNLKKLDNIDVTEDELNDALNGGSRASSIMQDDVPYEDAFEAQTPQEQLSPQTPRSAQHPYSPMHRGVTPQREASLQTTPTSTEETASGPSDTASPLQEYYQPDRRTYPTHYRHSQIDLAEWEDYNNAQSQYASTAALHHPGQRRSAGPAEIHERLTGLRNGGHPGGRPENGSDWDENERIRPRRGPMPNGRLSEPSSVVQQTYEAYQRRPPASHNSNLLSASLCLVRELDYHGLEVLEHATLARMRELSEVQR